MSKSNTKKQSLKLKKRKEKIMKQKINAQKEQAEFKKQAKQEEEMHKKAHQQESGKYFKPNFSTIEANFIKGMEEAGAKEVRLARDMMSYECLFPVLEDSEGRTHVPMRGVVGDDGKVALSFM